MAMVWPIRPSSVFSRNDKSFAASSLRSALTRLPAPACSVLARFRVKSSRIFSRPLLEPSVELVGRRVPMARSSPAMAASMSASVAKLLNDPVAVPMPSDAVSEATPGTVSEEMPV